MTARQHARSFTPLAPTPNHDELEREIIQWWNQEGIFEKLRTQTKGGPSYSFIDGPVTANKTLGVHTAWGRTLKDVFQRYRAMNGHELRFQNGFDCQGLWIEVGVEQELGLNSKREIEEYGLENFARKCREKVAWSVKELIRGSKRLGYWMDWGSDYLTFSDNNIEYIWRFLKTIEEKGWLYKGHRSTEWCPRCGTSISQHEISMSGVYQEKSDPSVYVRLPLREREGESLVVWTTTPWTLPANVSAAVHPEYEYGRRPNGEWVAVGMYPEDEFEERVNGSEMVGWRYTGPFDDLEPASEVEHRVIPWDEVTLDQGTGIVHIAPGCGEEDFLLSGELDLPVLMPVDESGHFYPRYGWLAGMSTSDAALPIIDDLKEKGRLVEAGDYVHSYPHCWRCDTPLIFRIADDWYIDVTDIRPQLLDANATVEWIPAYMGKLMDDWLNNMGDWNISRRRFYGLPLPFYPCECGHLNVIGSRAELLERATAGVDQLEELHRPWVDRVLITCESCDRTDLARIAEVGDVWLDAGIVPFSTLGWSNDEWVPEGNATGAAAGLTEADLPDHEYWQKWFPADWVSEMREQVRLWFYSQLFMSVALVGTAPFKKVLGYEKMLAEDGREMHGSWGNLIMAEEAFERMGADVMRWLYCAHPPDRNLRFGYAGAHEVQRKLLTLWNSARFLVDYGNIEGFSPSYADLKTGPSDVELKEIDRWLLARADQAVIEANRALDEYRVDELVEDFEAYLDDLSNWYIRRNRRRFYEYDEAAFRTLWVGVVTALRIISPVLPFLSDHLWSALVVAACNEAPESVHLAGWPASTGSVDEKLLSEMAMTRRVVEAGRRARSEANIKLRQPIRKVIVRGGQKAAGHIEDIKSELRVKEVVFDEETQVEVTIKPNFPVAGPRLGGKVKEVAAALERGHYEIDDQGNVLAAGEELKPEEVIRTERVVLEGWIAAHDGAISVAIDPELDDELIKEGRALELIRLLNDRRKQAGLELTDRIALRLPTEHADLVDSYQDWIASEVLATSVKLDDSLDEPELMKTEAPGETA
jgi:isoleucyl-tRNA synthetase